MLVAVQIDCLRFADPAQRMPRSLPGDLVELALVGPPGEETGPERAPTMPSG